MKGITVALKYAQGLLNCIASQALAEQCLNELEVLNKALDYSQLYLFFSSPQFTQTQKQAAIQKHLFSQEMRAFVSLLIDKRRMKHFAEIVKQYRRLYYKKHGIIQAKLTTATGVSQEALEKIELKLKKTYQKPVVIEQEVDPKLLGGGILGLNNKILDFSVKNKLQELKKGLLSLEVENNR
ncbi:hypothetical protein PHSC3_000733 [Chlamydiales bacterium STE3]|nr:hypothetical protein PHSC3_000733 [Chlamydiales bacterium STE3]